MGVQLRFIMSFGDDPPPLPPPPERNGRGASDHVNKSLKSKPLSLRKGKSGFCLLGFHSICVFTFRARTLQHNSAHQVTCAGWRTDEGGFGDGETFEQHDVLHVHATTAGGYYRPRRMCTGNGDKATSTSG